MYVPAHFAVDDVDALIARLTSRSAGVLITIDEDGVPVGTHMPILWDAERRIAAGHIARANLQWKQGASKGLIVLNGPEAYITPSWYPSKAEHGKAVPTWSYEAVHITGAVKWIDAGEPLEAIVRDLATAFERERPAPWTMAEAPRAYIDALLRGIVGVELHAERVEAKRKLSQNKSGADFDGVAAGLAATDDPLAHEVAALMREVHAVSNDADGN